MHDQEPKRYDKNDEAAGVQVSSYQRPLVGFDAIKLIPLRKIKRFRKH
jgi:hypothetical protein